MFKSKKFRIILIIFAAITAVGVITALFGGASSSSSGSKSSHEHEFEVISSEPGTCTNPGNETLRCKTCFYKETRESLNVPHSYNEYNICNLCGYSDTFELLATTRELTYDETDDIYLCDFTPSDSCLFYVQFNYKDAGSIYDCFVAYDHDPESYPTKHYLDQDSESTEVYLYLKDNELYLGTDSTDWYGGGLVVTVYKNLPNISNCVFIDSEEINFSYFDVFVGDVKVTDDCLLTNVTEITIKPTSEHYDEVMDVDVYSVYYAPLNGEEVYYDYFGDEGGSYEITILFGHLQGFFRVWVTI